MFEVYFSNTDKYLNLSYNIKYSKYTIHITIFLTEPRMMNVYVLQWYVLFSLSFQMGKW